MLGLLLRLGRVRVRVRYRVKVSVSVLGEGCVRGAV